MRQRVGVVILAFLTAGAVLAWPASPTWRVPTSAKTLLGFAPDGGRVFVANYPRAITAHDAATGRVVDTVFLRGLDPDTFEAEVVALSPDARAAVALCVNGFNPRFGWSLHDAATGERRATGPWLQHHVHDAAFSPDGRWLVTRSFGDKPAWNYAVADATTGATVATFVAGATEQPRAVVARGDVAAVVWRLADGSTDSVEWVALPSGERLGRRAVPCPGRMEAAAWVGKRLWLDACPTPDPPQTHYRVVYERPAPNTGPVMTITTTTTWPPTWTPDWRAAAIDPRVRVWRRMRRDGLGEQVQAFAARFGPGGYTPPTDAETRVRVVDPISDAVLDEPAAWLPDAVVASPDGRAVAALGPAGLELWPTATLPRWPVAVLIAVVAAWICRPRRATR